MLVIPVDNWIRSIRALNHYFSHPDTAVHGGTAYFSNAASI
jgi:hypothetical protein